MQARSSPKGICDSARRSLVLGIPAKVKRELTDAEVENIDEYARRYYQYKETYLEMRGSRVT